MAEHQVGSIHGYRALVVGASSGIGRAVVNLLTECGAAVVAGDLPGASWPTDETDRSVARLPIDVTDVASVELAVHDAIAELDGIDAVVNCAEPRGIRVNSVSPGYIQTPMFYAEISREDHAGILAQISSGRFGTADDVANAVAFLASDEASDINGQDLIIDGGLVAAIPGSTG